MENSQSNLAGLGTKPIELNIGGIIENQMRFLAERLEKKELAKKQAEVERSKRISDITNKYNIIDPIQTNAYMQNEANRIFQETLSKGQEITRRWKDDEISEDEAIRLYQINQAVPKQVQSILDASKSKINDLMSDEGDETLNAPAKKFMEETIGKGNFKLDLTPNGVNIVTLNDEGEEVSRPAEEQLGYINHHLKVYKNKVDVNKWLGDMAEATKSVKTDNGYVTYEGTTFEGSRSNILNNIKSQAPNYNNMLEHEVLRKLWLLSGRNLIPPEKEEDYNKFLEETTDKTKYLFKENSSTTIDPNAGSKRDNLLLSNQYKRNAIKKQNQDLNQVNNVNKKNYNVAKARLKINGKLADYNNAVAFNLPTGKNFVLGDAKDYDSVLMGNNGKFYINQGGVTTELKENSKIDKVAKQLGLNSIEELRAKGMANMEAVSENKTTTQKIQTAFNNGVNRIKTFAGSPSGGASTKSTNKNKTTKQYPL